MDSRNSHYFIECEDIMLLKLNLHSFMCRNILYAIRDYNVSYHSLRYWTYLEHNRVLTINYCDKTVQFKHEFWNDLNKCTISTVKYQTILKTDTKTDYRHTMCL